MYSIWQWHPPVGVYIAILALLGVCVPLIREKVGPREKALWTCVMFALVLLEIKSIYQDRKEHDVEQAAARAEEIKSFNSIAGGINQAIAQSQKNFDATMNELSNDINLQTGGNSYVYFDPLVLGDTPSEIELPGIHKGSMIATANLHCVGTFPLHNVYVSIFGPLGHLSDIDYGTIFCGELGRIRQGLTMAFQPDRPKQSFVVFINTSNGSYSQNIRLENSGGHWVWASRFYKVGNKIPLRTWASVGFPKDQLNANWDN